MASARRPWGFSSDLPIGSDLARGLLHTVFQISLMLYLIYIIYIYSQVKKIGSRTIFNQQQSYSIIPQASTHVKR